MCCKTSNECQQKIASRAMRKKLMTLEKNVQGFSGSLIPAMYYYM